MKMNFKVLGSGGAVRIPKACCSCDICTEARERGYPYKRLGQSLYLSDVDILFDTPEDIVEELNAHDIKNIDHIVYSHWHPDHTMGCRVIELLADYDRHLEVHLPEESIDVKINGNSLFEFYEANDYCKIRRTNHDITVEAINIKRIRLTNGFAYGFLITEGDKKVFYCPCHTNCIPKLLELYDIDLFILCMGYMSNQSESYTSFEKDTLKAVEEFRPKRTIITHIEETDRLGYDDYVSLEKSLKDIEFAYDGMLIQL